MNTQNDPIITKILTAMANLNLPPIRHTANSQKILDKMKNTNNSDNQKKAI
jgi:hypothetical protein